jgi:hypothetical protein
MPVVPGQLRAACAYHQTHREARDHALPLGASGLDAADQEWLFCYIRDLIKTYV